MIEEADSAGPTPIPAARAKAHSEPITPAAAGALDLDPMEPAVELRNQVDVRAVTERDVGLGSN